MYQVGGSMPLPNHSPHQPTAKSGLKLGQWSESYPAVRSAVCNPSAKKVQIVPGGSQGLSRHYSASAASSSSDRYSAS